MGGLPSQTMTTLFEVFALSGHRDAQRGGCCEGFCAFLNQARHCQRIACGAWVLFRLHMRIKPAQFP